MQNKPKFKDFKKEERTGYLFILMPLLQLVIFLIIPMVISLYLSFNNWNVITPPKFVGLENYINAIQDTYFLRSIYNTLFLMIGIPIGMILSLVLAIMINQNIKGIKIFRVIFYIPCVCAGVAIAILWQWIYNKDLGILNSLLWQFFHIQGPGWLRDAFWVKPAFIFMGIWSGLGSTMILYLAALQNVSKEYYEAADIDGANFFSKFIYITIPMVTPVSFFILTMGIIGGLQSFGQTFIMTPDGGPGYSSATIVFYIWQKAFGQYKMGYASAVAWMLGAFIMIVTIIQFRLQNKWVNHAE